MANDSPLVRKLRQFISLSADELAGLAVLETPSRSFAAGTELLYEHQIGHRAFLLKKGWACLYKLLPDGGRQVIDLAVPGDIVGLRSILLRASDQAISAMTDITVAEVSERKLKDSFNATPKLGTALLWAASRDQAMVVEHLVGVGRRSAIVRTAHFLLELGLRLQLVGLGTATGYACPINQYVLADALGLTAIHLNRVLRQLREQGLLLLRDGQVQFLDVEALRTFTGYDSRYLDQHAS